jgi:putative ABC transport system permease protein
MMFFRLLREGFALTISVLVVNRLRTFLSLLGITIGIFAIISVFSVIDSLKISIKSSIESLGDNVIYIQKWPWEFGEDYAWWKYMNRPMPNIRELEYVSSHSGKTQTAAFLVSSMKNVEYRNASVDNVTVIAASQDYDRIRTFEIEKGRYFSTFESASGQSKVIIGTDIAKALFGEIDPVGKEMKVAGHKVTVLGVFAPEGTDLFNQSADNMVLMPINFGRNIFDMRDERMNPMIMVKAMPGVDLSELNDELRGVMRAVRRLRPVEEDNFALNRASLITQGFDDLFVVVDIAGLIIGGFAILVGGFGIANIMFVSVKERTKLIGIEKSLGAKNSFILYRFLTESVILSLIGGIIGLLLIWIGVSLVNYIADMDLVLTVGNIVKGVMISVGIGIISGLAPAMSASRLNPVEAMNSNF